MLSIVAIVCLVSLSEQIQVISGQSIIFNILSIWGLKLHKMPISLDFHSKKSNQFAMSLRKCIVSLMDKSFEMKQIIDSLLSLNSA